ncbi:MULTISPECIES: Flp family type IVb pilin [Cryptosporangium]|uniref:Flp family type IVb pilin n=1 Tax=Cryptosporangium japonicum TaxID=80872 RepID=A0ABN0TVF1_9ACTN|nr:Flp family type IVb pilin [Cryptosporangium arvum]
MFLYAYTAIAERAVALKDRANDRGATAVEYGLLAALIAAVIVATVVTLGGKINTAFNTISSKLP